MKYAAYALPSVLPSTWGGESEAISETLFAVSRLLEQLHDSAVVGTASSAGSHAVAEAEVAARKFEDAAAASGPRLSRPPSLDGSDPVQSQANEPAENASAVSGEQAKLSAAESARRAAARLRHARRGARRSGVLGSSAPSGSLYASPATASRAGSTRATGAGPNGEASNGASRDVQLRWMLSALGGVGAAAEVGSSFLGGSATRDNAVVALELMRFFMRLSLLIRRVHAGGDAGALHEGAGGRPRRATPRRGPWGRFGKELGLAAEDVLSATRLLLLGERRDGRDTTLADSAGARAAPSAAASGGLTTVGQGGSSAENCPRPTLARRFLVAGGEADTGWARSAAEEAI